MTEQSKTPAQIEAEELAAEATKRIRAQMAEKKEKIKSDAARREAVEEKIKDTRKGHSPDTE